MDLIAMDSNLDGNFERIAMYCDRADYKKAQEELDKMEAYCSTPAQKARYHYARGYINYATVSQLSALAEYQKGLREDPDDTLKLKKECAYSKKLIKKEFAELRKKVLLIVDFIKVHYGKIAESDKIRVDDHTFQLLLGYYQSIQMPRIDVSYIGFPSPRDNISLGFEDYFAKLTGERQENAKKYLKEAYNITDRESYLECLHHNSNLNMDGYINDVRAFLKDGLDTGCLDEDETFYLGAKTEFVKVFWEYLPTAGVIAWDLSAKIVIARLAFACELIDREQYCHDMNAMTDVIKDGFSSFEEYALSFVFGSGLLMFKVKSMNITKATDFMFGIMGYLDMGNLLDTRWEYGRV